MQAKNKTVQFEGDDMKLDRKLLDREFKPTQKQVKKCLKKVVRKKDSNSTEKRKYKVKYTKKKKRQKMQDITGIQFITKKNISHYVSVRTNG